MKDTAELEMLAKRLYVAKIEQRNIDGQHYGHHMYQETTLEECRIELGLPPLGAQD